MWAKPLCLVLRWGTTWEEQHGRPVLSGLKKVCQDLAGLHCGHGGFSISLWTMVGNMEGNQSPCGPSPRCFPGRRYSQGWECYRYLVKN